MIRVGGPASPYDPTYHLFVRFDKIASIVERERPDVLEIHSPYLAALGALRTPRSHFGIRTFQWHSDFIDTYVGVLEGRIGAEGVRARSARLVTRPLWGLVRSIARRSAATLVAAKWQAEKLEAHGVSNVVRVPFGIERSVFRPDARSYEGRRRLLALAGRDAGDDGVAILVGVGRFAIEKRWDVVLDAFARVREKRDAILVLFGDGPERERMRERASASRDVVLPGFATDRHELASSLASADVMVHGCPFETFGLSIAEAMSTGLPVVVPDRGGASEMHDPDAGERYRALDVVACADAVIRLLDRVAKDGAEVRAAAANAAARLPDVRRQFEHQVEIYERLLASR